LHKKLGFLWKKSKKNLNKQYKKQCPRTYLLDKSWAILFDNLLLQGFFT